MGQTAAMVTKLVETAVSTSVRVGDDVYVNVWSCAPTVEQLEAIIAGERQLPIGYRSLEVVERMDHLRFGAGVRARFSAYADEFVGRAAKNIVVVRAGGFAGTVIYGVVGMFNAVGIKTPVLTKLDDGIAALLAGASAPTVDATTLKPIIEALVAEHLARVPR